MNNVLDKNHQGDYKYKFYTITTRVDKNVSQELNASENRFTDL